MVEVTDAAVGAKYRELWDQWAPSKDQDSFGVHVIQHFLTARQPKPEDVERLAGIVWPWIKPVNWAISEITPWENVVKGSLDHQAALGCARAILDAYDPPPARHAPTPADLGRINAILQPFLGQMHVRDRIAEAFLAEFSVPSKREVPTWTF
jgi:hypothetical protein